MIVLSGAFGALPPYTALTPQDEDCGMGGNFCFGKNLFLWVDGLGPGNPTVVNFAGRYAKAMKISKQAESLPIGNALRSKGKKLDTELLEAITEVWQNYPWDNKVCYLFLSFGHETCRTPDRVTALKAGLVRVNEALRAYDKFELQLAPYISKIEAQEAAAAAALAMSTSSSAAMTADEPLWPKLLMFGIPAAVLLFGGMAVLFKKPKPKPAVAVAGYRRRRRR